MVRGSYAAARGPWAVRCGLQSVGAIGGLQDQNGPPGPNFAGNPGVPWDHKLAHGLEPLRGSRTINILASPNLQGRSWCGINEAVPGRGNYNRTVLNCCSRL
ncbi:hypothetical protein O181_117855 [Austropuccinia psidii MF-1]|uniref:Uncharacterized protein n=1 Tax=Austropuccinia psidii MF-1 TaxID=1389203 RepID=A0A9Q3KF68_9BASI|nr:hypothetical protein [Austropuccinia psidii MF-1]